MEDTWCEGSTAQGWHQTLLSQGTATPVSPNLWVSLPSGCEPSAPAATTTDAKWSFVVGNIRYCQFITMNKS